MAEPPQQNQHAVKLFVGQVPKHLTEEQLLAHFRNFAVVDRVNIIRNRHSGAPEGCCFLFCPSKEEADRAIAACHNLQTLPGASSPLQVKYAFGELERLEHKLFVGMLPRNVSADEVSELFSRYGAVTDMQILRGSLQTVRACAFIKYGSRDEAIAAIEALNDIHRMEGSTVPLVVKWADTQRERLARRAQKAQHYLDMSNSVQRQPMFGPLPYGYFPPYNNEYGYQAPGSYGMMPYSLSPVQNRPPFHNLIPPVDHSGNSYGSATPDLSPGISPRGYAMSASSYMGPTYPVGPGPHYPMAYTSGMMTAPLSPITPPHCTGPAGANLFVYNIPQEYGDEELVNSFQQFGIILSAKVYIDKSTGNSKCFGFVSYSHPASAQAAIRNMHGFGLGDKILKVELKRENYRPYY